jgi:hypothetical protein
LNLKEWWMDIYRRHLPTRSTVEGQCSRISCTGFWPFVITHFNTTASTYHNLFWENGMRWYGLWVGFHTFVLLHQSLPTQSSCLALGEVHCFHSLWYETLV